MADQLEADYETLAEIAKRFARRAERARTIKRRLAETLAANSGWQGEDSQAFAAGIEETVQPTLKRLIKGLKADARNSWEVL